MVAPAVVVLEDLHWAGEAMLAFVEYLLTRDLEAPLLIICTTRPELLQQHEGPLTTDPGDGRLRRMKLPTLSEQQTGALVAALLDAEPSLGAPARIADIAGGNPLYAEQYVRLLLDRDLVVQGSDGLRLVQDADLSLPATVHAVLAARLDTLTPEHKALLCDAAVLGETFWRGGVAALSGREESTVEEAMHALLARDFVRAVVVSTMEGELEYLFWHALARDVAYGQLPRGVRARKHQAAALWMRSGPANAATSSPRSSPITTRWRLTSPGRSATSSWQLSCSSPRSTPSAKPAIVHSASMRRRQSDTSLALWSWPARMPVRG